MSPDLYFALTLIVKMAITAGFVLAATVTAERAGPLVGGLVATLPLGAGPVYVFLSLDHDAHFIAQSAIGSLAINTVNVIFAMIYALLAQKRSLPVSLSAACWRGSRWRWIIHALHWTLVVGVLANVAVLGDGASAGTAAAPRDDTAGAHALVRPTRCAPPGGAAGRDHRVARASASGRAAAASSRCSRSSSSASC